MGSQLIDGTPKKKKKKKNSTNLCQVNLALACSEGGERRRQRQQARVTAGKHKDVEAGNTREVTSNFL